MTNTKLAEFRKSKKLSRKQMYETLKISKSLYEKIEYGIRKPSRAFIEKFLINFPKADIRDLFFNT